MKVRDIQFSFNSGRFLTEDYPGVTKLVIESRGTGSNKAAGQRKSDEAISGRRIDLDLAQYDSLARDTLG